MFCYRARLLDLQSKFSKLQQQLMGLQVNLGMSNIPAPLSSPPSLVPPSPLPVLGPLSRLLDLQSKFSKLQQQLMGLEVNLGM